MPGGPSQRRRLTRRRRRRQRTRTQPLAARPRPSPREVGRSPYCARSRDPATIPSAEGTCAAVAPGVAAVPHRRSAFVVVPVAVAALFIAVALAAGLGRRPVGLADYLGWRDAQTPDLAAREARVVQHRIAACMAALGLPYREFVEPPPEIPDADLGATRLGREVGLRGVDLGRGRQCDAAGRRPEPRLHRFARARAGRGVPRRPLRIIDRAGLQPPGERAGLRPPRPAAGRARAGPCPARGPDRARRRASSMPMPGGSPASRPRRSDRRVGSTSGRRPSTS